MNLIPMIREQLGLDENEEFNLINPNGVPFPERFRFTNDSLQIHPQEWEEAHGMTLRALLRGDLKVAKLPFKPRAGEWIPIEEGLPNYDEPVLVTYRCHSTKETYNDQVAYLDVCGYWYWEAEEDIESVKIMAWMPLPKKYTK